MMMGYIYIYIYIYISLFVQWYNVKVMTNIFSKGLSGPLAYFFINGMCTNHYFYADDMYFLAPSANGLQLIFDVCSSYGNEHDVLYNPIKSKYITFLPKQYKLSVPTVSLDGNTLYYVDQIKYLDVILSSCLLVALFLLKSNY